jgi:hypothetical protein
MTVVPHDGGVVVARKCKISRFVHGRGANVPFDDAVSPSELIGGRESQGTLGASRNPRNYILDASEGSALSN